MDTRHVPTAADVTTEYEDSVAKVVIYDEVCSSSTVAATLSQSLISNAFSAVAANCVLKTFTRTLSCQLVSSHPTLNRTSRKLSRSIALCHGKN